MYHPGFKGSHYDIGLRFGRILKKQNIDFNKIINFFNKVNDLSEFHEEFGRKSQKILADVFPEICDEIRGLTDGLQFPYERFATWLLCMACCLKGCTVFCFKYNNNIIYGRNNDLPPALKKTSVSALYYPDNGFSFIGNTSSMIHFEEGLNENGLAVAMTFVLPKIIRPGLNSVFLVRYILEKCSTVEEGIKALRSLPVASAGNILLADKKGDMVVAECTPDKIFLRRPGRNKDFIVSVNHFTSDEMKDHDASNRDVFFSDARYKTAYNALKNIAYTDGVEHAKAILSGKHGFICQYDKKLDFDTIWSSVFDISNNKIYRAEGNPARTKFKEDFRFNRHLKI
ncbi:MAG: linear amide C-N hydrolase [Spirochaetes bacterium]|nr:linear amide C-N hydrolase [Spirochaetota bacterium]